jgi:hypothetical protein
MQKRKLRIVEQRCLVFVVLMSYQALAQISSGTSIIFNLTKDEIVVAADSRGVNDTAPPDDSECKISAFRHQFIFVTVGKTRYTRLNPTDPLESWDNADAARSALSNASKDMVIDNAYMDAVANYWASIIKSHWDRLCTLNQLKCMPPNSDLAGLGMLNPWVAGLTTGIFVGAKGLFIKGAVIEFDSDFRKFLNHVDYKIGDKLAQCWPCGQGEQVCAAGSHMDVAAQFCTERKPNTKLSVRTPLIGADEHAKLAVEIVEKTIDNYEKSVGDVGGEVDAVTITRDGNLTWNHLKKGCQENQD